MQWLSFNIIYAVNYGASEGNRTLVGSLEGYCTTTVLRSPVIYLSSFTNSYIKGLIYTIQNHCQTLCETHLMNLFFIVTRDSIS